MPIQDLLKNLTEQFIELWNNSELEQIGHFFKEDVVIYSPNISKIFPDNLEGKIIGKSNVIVYWQMLIQYTGEIKVELESFEKIDRQINTVSKIIGRVEKLYTQYSYNEYGKVIEIKFDYK